MEFLLLAVLIGMRHGMDGDHVAAIADMVGTVNQRKRQVTLGLMYAFGHGFIVFLIGLLTIFVGTNLPEGAQSFVELLVSLTLLFLGGIILHSLLQRKKQYEFKSRLKIVAELVAKLRNKVGKGEVKVSPVLLGVNGAFIIGIVHGIGVESPTQIAVITNAVGLDSMTAATVQLILFVVGLLASTVVITFLLSWGFLKASLKQGLYIVLGSITGVYSVGLGVWMLLGLFF